MAPAPRGQVGGNEVVEEYVYDTQGNQVSAHYAVGTVAASSTLAAAATWPRERSRMAATTFISTTPIGWAPNVGSKTLEYNAYKLPDGTINVGRITIK